MKLATRHGRAWVPFIREYVVRLRGGVEDPTTLEFERVGRERHLDSVVLIGSSRFSREIDALLRGVARNPTCPRLVEISGGTRRGSVSGEVDALLTGRSLVIVGEAAPRSVRSRCIELVQGATVIVLTSLRDRWVHDLYEMLLKDTGCELLLHAPLAFRGGAAVFERIA